MRETIIGAAFVIAIIGAFLFFQKSESNIALNTVSAPVASGTQAPIAPVAHVAKHLAKKKVAPVEPVESAEAAVVLPSIYSQPSDEAKPSAESLRPSANWHGVAVNAWLQSQNSALPKPPVAGAAPGNLRLFVQCMELKKDGPLEVAERECRKLRAGLPNEEMARLGGLPGSPTY